MKLYELTTSIQELKDLIKDREKELLEIPEIKKEIVNSILISVPIKRHYKSGEFLFAYDSK